MKNKFMRSVTSMLVAVTMLISSQGVVTSFADGGDYSDKSESSSVQMNEENNGKTVQCDCNATEGEAHKEGCPLYQEPEQPQAPSCSCGVAEGTAHKEGCPLYNDNSNGGNAENGAGEDTAVDAVVEMINALPAVEIITEETDLEALKTQISDARAAYNALNEDQKLALDPVMVEKLEALERLLTSKTYMPQTNGTGTKDNPLIVPIDGMVIQDDTYYGISKAWFQKQNPDKKTLYFSLVIPDTVTTIYNDSLKDSWHPDKTNKGAVTSNDNLGRYSIVSIDFSNAINLTTINNQAAMNCSDLTGVLDLSATSVETLGKSAFSGCSGLTGVILPSTLKVLGTKDGSSGSVFNGCTGLQFIRTADGNPDSVFELPKNLEVIGKQTFRNTFPLGKDIIAKIPSSVETVGSEAFYSNGCFLQIFIERTQDYSGYNSGAFKATENKDSLLIFPNSSSYNATDTFTRIQKTYPVTLEFQMEDGSVQEQKKLYKQSIRYELDTDGVWVKDAEYTLPKTPEISENPGYRAGWQIEGSNKTLTVNGIVDGWTYDVLKVTASDTTNTPVFTDPIIKPTINGKVVDFEGNSTGIVYFNLKVPEYQIGSATPPTVGVQVDHPLAGEGDGKYKVYFEYRWRDVKNSTVPEGASEILEGETDANLKITSSDMLRYNVPDNNPEDESVDYYVVEIFGYYQPVEAKNKAGGTLFYKSSHTAIAPDNNTVNTGYRITVQADDTILPPTPGPDPDPNPNPDPTPGSKPNEDRKEESNFPRIKLPTTTIDDEDVPLADLPTTTIEDEEVPLKDIPNTGDMIPVAAMAAAALSLGGVVVLSRKKK